MPFKFRLLSLESEDAADEIDQGAVIQEFLGVGLLKPLQEFIQGPASNYGIQVGDQGVKSPQLIFKLLELLDGCLELQVHRRPLLAPHVGHRLSG